MALYLSFDDTCRMLQQAIVQYNKRLVFVRHISPDLEATAIDLETGERFTFKADFEKIENPKDGRLGYINQPGRDAFFLIRVAARMYKMGYCNENLSMMKEGNFLPLRSYLGCYMEGINDCYHNVFPTFEEGLILAKETGKIVAYDRSFAVNPRGIIFYQTYKVGHAGGAREENIQWTKKGLLASFIRQRPTLNWR